MKWTVTLERMPYLPNRSWQHDTRRSALIRVIALNDLHNDCGFMDDPAMKLFVVRASMWYKPRENRYDLKAQ